MEDETPKQIKDLLGITPIAVHSAYFVDFADGYELIKDLYYNGYRPGGERIVSLAELHNCKEDEVIDEVKKTIDNAYVELINNGLYWGLCTSKTYIETYEERKKSFFNEYLDGDEIDFLNDEIQTIEDFQRETIQILDESGYPQDTDEPFLANILNESNFKNVQFSFKKRKRFIRDKIEKLTGLQGQTIKTPNTIESLNFKGSQTQLIELIKALIESDMIAGTQTNAIKQFSNFLNIKINNPDKLIQDIKHKNNDSQTAFLDLLKDSLLKYLSK